MHNNFFYITNEGLDKIIYEMQYLQRKEEYKLKDESKTFSRNKTSDLDYINSLEELSFIRRRINEIKHILENARLIKTKSKSAEFVDLGAQVTVVDESTKEAMSFIIVDTLEADPAGGKISKNSPVGAALMGHRTNESVFLRYPTKRKYVIKKIRYN